MAPRHLLPCYHPFPTALERVVRRALACAGDRHPSDGRPQRRRPHLEGRAQDGACRLRQATTDRTPGPLPLRARPLARPLTLVCHSDGPRDLARARPAGVPLGDIDATFASADADGSGMLDMRELKRMLRQSREVRPRRLQRLRRRLRRHLRHRRRLRRRLRRHLRRRLRRPFPQH